MTTRHDSTSDDAKRETVPTSRWAAVPGFTGYEVSEIGEFRSFRSRSFRRTLKPRTHNTHISPHGYVYVKIANPQRVSQTRQIHRLVLEAFVGPCPEGHEGCHRDGDKLNNRLDNLYWGTRHENCMDTARHGRNKNARLTPEQITEVMQLRREGWPGRKLAAKFGVNRTSIRSLIVNREPALWGLIKKNGASA